MVLPDAPGSQGTSSLIGVALAIGAGILIALGLNVQRRVQSLGFLRNKLWLLGFGLMNGGELCNFLAYAFAPPSVVAPLGMVTLIANVFLAPLVVREPFRKKDLIGVAIAVLGGATVVYASHSNDTKLTPHQFLKAISRPLFIAYSATSLVAIILLAWLSRTKYGDRFVLIDLVLCALAGSFTVLSTKAISSFLNLMFLDTFKHWVTYPVLLVLVVTAVVQVNFVNKSLQRFESRVVIPIQYMTFALSTIVGSAILYRDFEGIGLPSLINFAFGCLVSGGGVYLLTRDAPSQSSNEGESSSTGRKQGDSSADGVMKDSSSARPRNALPPNAKTIILDVPASIDASTPSSSKRLGDSSAGSHSTLPPNGSSSPRSDHHQLLLRPIAAAVGDPTVSATAIRPAMGGRPRTVSLTLGGGYLLAASPGAVVRAATAAAADEADEDEDDEDEVEEEEDGEDVSSDEDEEEEAAGRQRRGRRQRTLQVEGEC
ncbi:hypothetical protein B0A53_02565 [Rhodotorula sp. CCFEE 5036]|nr:hypothetical protein B0A53_02565 [Rhodotorula sp. CCFEE 5036]